MQIALASPSLELLLDLLLAPVEGKKFEPTT
jgi:hypothetical protein